MSIKVYQAWRVPVKHLNEVFTAWRKELLSSVVVPGVLADVTPAPGQLVSDALRDRWPTVIARRDSAYRDLQDMTTVFAVWISGPYAVLRAIGNENIFENLQHEHAEDFSFWNNTDPPDDVSSHVWAHRRRFWNKTADGYYPRMEYVVFDPRIHDHHDIMWWSREGV